jgi:hypothetical protein
MVTQDGCEIVVHGGLCYIKFASKLGGTIFLIPYSIPYYKQPFFRSCVFLSYLGLVFPFFQLFYACSSPLYFSQISQHLEFIVFFLKFGTQYGNLMGKMLFTSTHLHTLHPIATRVKAHYNDPLWDTFGSSFIVHLA